MGCINYGTTPIEVENVKKQEQAKEQAKEQANLDTEKQEPCDEIEEPCDEIEEPCDEIENLKES